MEELIIRSLQGQADLADEVRLRAWRHESRENEALFQEISATWSALHEEEVETRPPHPAKIIARSESRPVALVQARRRRRRDVWIPALAAAVVLLAVGGAELLRRNMGNSGATLEAARVVAAPGATATTQLSDGTIVHLAAGSQLVVIPTPGRREVWLEGRAFFGVSKHADWPFMIRSRLGGATVLGTRFEFSTTGDTARVVVVDGRVAFEAGGRKVEVGESQMVRSDGSVSLVLSNVENVQGMLGWMGRSLVFHDTPLDQAAREIEARYGATVVIEDPRLRDLTLTGAFGDRSFENVLRAICNVLSADCVVEEVRAVISRRNP